MDSLVTVARMPACALVRYQALQQEASRHLARASTRGGVTSQLHASLNFLIDTRLRSWCEVVTRSRRPSTIRSYDQKWIKFETFTTQVQDDSGAPRMSALPASSQTVVAYLGFLLESDTISAKSLQTYLSAINVVHNVFEYPPPSCGHLVKLTCKGFAELQGSVMLQPQQVTTFPAEHMFAIVQFGSSSSATFCHASCLWKHHSFGNLSLLLRSRLSI